MITITSALQTYVQQTLVAQLKSFFTNHPDYTYSDSGTLTQISISTEFPQRSVKYPQIVVGSVSGQPLLRTIGGNLRGVIHGQRVINGLTIPNAICGYTIGGGHYISVSVHVAGNTTPERRLIIDNVSSFAQAFYFDTLSALGMTLSGMRLGPGSEEAIGNQYIYFDEIVLDFYTEWRQDFINVPVVTQVVANLCDFTGF